MSSLCSITERIELFSVSTQRRSVFSSLALSLESQERGRVGTSCEVDDDGFAMTRCMENWSRKTKKSTRRECCKEEVQSAVTRRNEDPPRRGARGTLLDAGTHGYHLCELVHKGTTAALGLATSAVHQHGHKHACANLGVCHSSFNW